MPRPQLDELPYRALVRALLSRPGFKLDFNGLAPDAAVTMVCDRLLGLDAFPREREWLAADIDVLAAFAAALAGGRASVAIRTCFAAGDTVWHVDRVDEAAAFRLLWPLGRPAGMRVTPAGNIDATLYRAYARREHPLLCQLDTRVLRTGVPPETLWAHRPAQLRHSSDAEPGYTRKRQGRYWAYFDKKGERVTDRPTMAAARGEREGERRRLPRGRLGVDARPRDLLREQARVHRVDEEDAVELVAGDHAVPVGAPLLRQVGAVHPLRPRRARRPARPRRR